MIYSKEEYLIIFPKIKYKFPKSLIAKFFKMERNANEEIFANYLENKPANVGGLQEMEERGFKPDVDKWGKYETHIMEIPISKLQKDANDNGIEYCFMCCSDGPETEGSYEKYVRKIK
jgi:hypothetical protein